MAKGNAPRRRQGGGCVADVMEAAAKAVAEVEALCARQAYCGPGTRAAAVAHAAIVQELIRRASDASSLRGLACSMLAGGRGMMTAMADPRPPHFGSQSLIRRHEFLTASDLAEPLSPPAKVPIPQLVAAVNGDLFAAVLWAARQDPNVHQRRDAEWLERVTIAAREFLATLCDGHHTEDAHARLVAALGVNLDGLLPPPPPDVKVFRQTPLVATPRSVQRLAIDAERRAAEIRQSVEHVTKERRPAKRALVHKLARTWTWAFGGGWPPKAAHAWVAAVSAAAAPALVRAYGEQTGAFFAERLAVSEDAARLYWPKKSKAALNKSPAAAPGIRPTASSRKSGGGHR